VPVSPLQPPSKDNVCKIRHALPKSLIVLGLFKQPTAGCALGGGESMNNGGCRGAGDGGCDLLRLAMDAMRPAAPQKKRLPQEAF